MLNSEKLNTERPITELRRILNAQELGFGTFIWNYLVHNLSENRTLVQTILGKIFMTLKAQKDLAY